VIAISIIAAMCTNILHEGVGHGCIALLTGAHSGLLTTVAWSSDFDSRLVAAGGTLVNLAAGALLWMALRGLKNANVSLRYFLLLAFAFNLFAGTGYFLFSGFTNFGDWAAVISPMNPHWLWRVLLVCVGLISYFAAVLVVGIGLVRYVGIPLDQQQRLFRLVWVPYVSAILLVGWAGLLNPIGSRLVWQSALPATAGAYSGLLWLRYYIPKKNQPLRIADGIRRDYVWILFATIAAIFFVAVLGRGVTLHR
jgi:hypothetical protein